jgi:DNA uptake protein ComE-like DNA-binding protein
MFPPFGKVDAKRQGARSPPRERYSPGELRQASLRASPRRAFAGLVLVLGFGVVLGVGAIPTLWYVSRAWLPAPEVTTAETGAARGTKPEVQVAEQNPQPAEPRPAPEPIVLTRSSPATSGPAPPSVEESEREAPTVDPSSTGSITIVSREADQTQARRPVSTSDESPATAAVQQVVPRPETPSDHVAATRDDLVDLNTASVEKLSSLGIGLVGRRLVENRPYARPEDLLTKRVLTRKDFEQIRSKVTAR